MDDFASLLGNGLDYAFPLAGAYVVFRIILGFQKSVVDNTEAAHEKSVARGDRIEARLLAAEKKIDGQMLIIEGQSLEITHLKREVEMCDMHNDQMVEALEAAGISVPKRKK